MIVFGTGHRPEDCGMKIEAVHEFAMHALMTHPHHISALICGMASGFDLVLGYEAMCLDIPVWSVRPWAGHRARKDDLDLYKEIERYAVRHIITNGSLSYPGAWVYQVRNQWMVDHADEGIAFWSGKESGGTFNCIKYAEKKGKPVRNIFPIGV